MTGLYKIEKNVPLVERQGYPFSKMEIGDSFFVPSFTKNETLANNLRNAGAYYCGKGSISARKVDGGYRVWRIK